MTWTEKYLTSTYTDIGTYIPFDAKVYYLQKSDFTGELLKAFTRRLNIIYIEYYINRNCCIETYLYKNK